MTAVRTRPTAEPVIDLTDGVPLLDLRDDPSAPAPSTPSAPDEEPRRAGHRLRRLWFVPAGVALLGAAALVPSVGGGGPGPGEARLAVDGVAVVTTADGERRTVRDDRTDVGPGDHVEVTEGTTRFEMADGVRLEGRAGRATGGRQGTTVVMAIAPRLVAGQLLAVAPRPLDLQAGDARVSVGPAASADGVARLDRRIGLAVGSYSGAVEVESAGRQADVPDLRRIDVAAPGAVGDVPQPLRYDPADPWDRLYLADALAIDAQLAPLLAGLGDRAAGFLDAATLADAMGLDSARDLRVRVADLDDGADALVLAAIATEARGRSVGPAWDGSTAFRSDGAPWGLVALDQDARASQVLAAVRDALDTLDLAAVPTATDATDRSAAPAADAAATPAPTAPAGTAGAAPDGSAATPGTTTPGADPTSPSGPTDPGGGGSPPVVPTTPTVPGLPGVPPVTTPPLPTPGQVGGTVGGVVDDVTDGVDTVLPGTGGTVDGVVGGVGGAVGDVGGTVGQVGGTVGGAVGGAVGAVGGIIGGLGTGLSSGFAPTP